MMKLFRCPNEHCNALSDEFILVEGEAKIHSMNSIERNCDEDEIPQSINHIDDKITIAFCKFCGQPVPFYTHCTLEKDRVYDYDDVLNQCEH